MTIGIEDMRILQWNPEYVCLYQWNVAALLFYRWYSIKYIDNE